MICLYCKKRLGLFAGKKKFCSELHEVAYNDEQSGLAMRRVLDPLFAAPIERAPLPSTREEETSAIAVVPGPAKLGTPKPRPVAARPSVDPPLGRIVAQPFRGVPIPPRLTPTDGTFPTEPITRGPQVPSFNEGVIAFEFSEDAVAPEEVSDQVVVEQEAWGLSSANETHPVTDQSSQTPETAGGTEPALLHEPSSADASAPEAEHTDSQETRASSSEARTGPASLSEQSGIQEDPAEPDSVVLARSSEEKINPEDAPTLETPASTRLYPRLEQFNPAVAAAGAPQPAIEASPEEFAPAVVELSLPRNESVAGSLSDPVFEAAPIEDLTLPWKSSPEEPLRMSARRGGGAHPIRAVEITTPQVQPDLEPPVCPVIPPSISPTLLKDEEGSIPVLGSNIDLNGLPLRYPVASLTIASELESAAWGGIQLARSEGGGEPEPLAAPARGPEVSDIWQEAKASVEIPAPATPSGPLWGGEEPQWNGAPDLEPVGKLEALPSIPKLSENLAENPPVLGQTRPASEQDWELDGTQWNGAPGLEPVGTLEALPSVPQLSENPAENPPVLGQTRPAPEQDWELEATKWNGARNIGGSQDSSPSVQQRSDFHPHVAHDENPSMLGQGPAAPEQEWELEFTIAPENAPVGTDSQSDPLAPAAALESPIPSGARLERGLFSVPPSVSQQSFPRGSAGLANSPIRAEARDLPIRPPNLENVTRSVSLSRVQSGLARLSEPLRSWDSSIDEGGDFQAGTFDAWMQSDLAEEPVPLVVAFETPRPFFDPLGRALFKAEPSLGPTISELSPNEFARPRFEATPQDLNFQVPGPNNEWVNLSRVRSAPAGPIEVLKVWDSTAPVIAPAPPAGLLEEEIRELEHCIQTPTAPMQTRQFAPQAAASPRISRAIHDHRRVAVEALDSTGPQRFRAAVRIQIPEDKLCGFTPSELPVCPPSLTWQRLSMAAESAKGRLGPANNRGGVPQRVPPVTTPLPLRPRLRTPLPR